MCVRLSKILRYLIQLETNSSGTVVLIDYRLDFVSMFAPIGPRPLVLSITADWLGLLHWRSSSMIFCFRLDCVFPGRPL